MYGSNRLHPKGTMAHVKKRMLQSTAQSRALVPQRSRHLIFSRPRLHDFRTFSEKNFSHNGAYYESGLRVTFFARITCTVFGQEDKTMFH